MAIHTTRWSPDTCGCVFEYDWDDTTSEDTRVHTFKQVVTECVSHAHLQGNGKRDMYDSSLEENRRKNNTIKTLIENGGTDLSELNENGVLVWKRGITLNYSWAGVAPNRVLNITLSGITLTPQKRNTYQSFIDNLFGVGKVVLL